MKRKFGDDQGITWIDDFLEDADVTESDVEFETELAIQNYIPSDSDLDSDADSDEVFERYADNEDHIMRLGQDMEPQIKKLLENVRPSVENMRENFRHRRNLEKWCKEYMDPNWDIKVQGKHLIYGLIAYMRVQCEDAGKFLGYDKNNRDLFGEGLGQVYDYETNKGNPALSHDVTQYMVFLKRQKIIEF
ncbi:hypothetical protein BKA69DRAFT_716373 [Paraphysoderma sedebokerense]|nr:hypothetical protein BKA69DRAFT_716373 [Paraphysoderma sedebokerense]